MITLTVRLYVLFIIASVFINKHKEGKLGGLWKIVGYIYGIFFVIEDVLFDVTIGSLWFLRLPEWSQRDKTFTARLKLMKATELPSSWRYKLAVKFCKLINRWDEGHC